jgi:AraC family transcriptional regulator
MKTTPILNNAFIAPLEPPHFVEGKPLLIAGLRGSYTEDSRNQIPALWQRFSPYLGKLSEQVRQAAYGLCFISTGNKDSFDYMAGTEVNTLSGLPAELSHLSIPAQTYAVFPHYDHVSKIKGAVC